jgi:hypothetical protein
MFKIEQWAGIKGVSFKIQEYNIAIFCKALQAFKLRNAGGLYKPTLKELIFNVQKNTRLILTEWDYDITILGFTWQIQKYQKFMCQ